LTGEIDLLSSISVTKNDLGSVLKMFSAGLGGSLGMSVEEGTLHLARGAYRNSIGTWIATNQVAVILEFTQDGLLKVYRNTGLAIDGPFAPELVGSLDTGTIPLPATSVVSETTYGQAPAVGTDITYAREDHTHGTPPNPSPSNLRYNTRLVTLSGPVVATDDVIIVDATLAPVTITLPLASDSGRRLEIKRINTPPNKVTVDGNGVETIDSSLSVDLIARYESLTVVSDGTEWWIV
jgi:hypothetical protein